LDRYGGAILGSIFVRLLPQAIAIMRDDLPFGIGRLPGSSRSLFGLVLVLVILFSRRYQWIVAEMKLWFQTYPFKRQTSGRRQKSYARRNVCDDCSVRGEGDFSSFRWHSRGSTP